LEKGKVYPVEITDIKVEKLFCPRAGKDSIKATVAVKPGKKRVAINKTSAGNLSVAFGKDFKQWVGKKITIEWALYKGRTPMVLSKPVRNQATQRSAALDAVKDLPPLDESQIPQDDGQNEMREP
jgi:hypothetical protein